MTDTSIARCLDRTETRLQACNHNVPAQLKIDCRLEAEILLAHALDKPRSYLRAYPELQLSSLQSSNLDQLVDRRLQGEPVAYITGHREFWSLDLITNRHTLIPRPETELLIELALQRIAQDEPLRIADLGTGSGAIALAIASERPLCNVLATDISPQALDTARQNANRHNVTNVEFHLGNWFDCLPAVPFDMILSNPPYVAENDVHLKQGDLRFEPITALSAGADGLDDIRVIIQKARDYLVDGGFLLLEHGFDQRQAIADILQQHGYLTPEFHDDLGGLARVMMTQK